MDSLTAFLDLVKGSFALGLFVYATRLYRVFRGGIMEGGFKLLLVAPLFFAITEFINMTRNIVTLNPAYKLVADAFEVLFVLAMFAGFYRLAKAWKIKDRPPK